MATDQKLISSLLDLSRNVDKLSGDIRKNITSTDDLIESHEKSAESGDKIVKVVEKINGLDLNSLKNEFNQLTKSIGELDFKGLSTDLKTLDFKELSNDIKSLDFKGFSKGIENLGLKDIGNFIKTDIKNIPNLAKEIIAKKPDEPLNSDKIEEIVSGSMETLLKKGKDLLGIPNESKNLEETFNSLIGDKLPELIKTEFSKKTTENPINDILETFTKNSGNSVMNNIKGLIPKDLLKNIESPLKEMSSLLNFDDKNPIFKEGLGNLNKSISSKIENILSPDSLSGFVGNIGKNFSEKLNLKKSPLFSGAFDTLNKVKNLDFGLDNPSELIQRGGSLLKGLDKNNLIGTGVGLAKSVGSMFSKNKQDSFLNKIEPLQSKNIIPTFKENKIPSLSTKIPEIKTPEIKKSITSLSPKPQPKLSSSVIESSTTDTGLPDNNLQKPVNDIKTVSKSDDKDSSKSNNQSESLSSKDIQEMKATLVRIALLLEGPLNVTSGDRVLRPDSRRI